MFQSIQRSQIFEPAAALLDSGAIPCKVGLDFRAGRTDVRRLLVVPGLIDLHTHVYWGGTSLGVDAAEVARRSGTTTFVDASTGSGAM